MLFTADLSIQLGKENYRLQKDYTWRKFENGEVIESDIAFSNPFEAQKECDIRSGKKLKIGNSEYVVNPKGLIIFGDPTIAFASPTIHRYTKPRKFTEDELRNVIASGVDNRNNVVILDIYGSFVLRDFNERLGLFHDPTIAVRNGCFCAGNGYVGLDAARDKEHADDTYNAMLGGWVAHLRTGKLNIFVDMPKGMAYDEMWEEVEELTRYLK